MNIEFEFATTYNYGKQWHFVPFPSLYITRDVNELAVTLAWLVFVVELKFLNNYGKW